MDIQSIQRRKGALSAPLVSALVAVALVGGLPGSAMAQGLFGRISKRVQDAVASEVANKADAEARNATRCVLGDAGCSPQASQGSETGGASGAAQDVTKGPSPLITAYAGSELQSRDYQDYTDYNRVIGMDKNRRGITQLLEGALTKLVYVNPKGRSTLELVRNYRAALEARGFTVDYEVPNAKGWILSIRQVNGMIAYGTDVRYFTGKLAYDGGTAYVSVLVYREGSGFGRTNIHVLQTNEMDADMVGVDPSAMAAELARSGEVTLRGVYFDTGRHSLKSESDPELAAIAALMAAQPQLTMAVVGHTDSTGSAAGNQLLSTERASAVRDALIVRGVAPTRLRALGMGSSQPIASNATEDGRAQNRRVMLIRQ